jgi:hypothetical protein
MNKMMAMKIEGMHYYLMKIVLEGASLKPQASMLLIVSVWAMMVEKPHCMFVVDGMLISVDIYSQDRIVEIVVIAQELDIVQSIPLWEHE